LTRSADIIFELDHLGQIGFIPSKISNFSTNQNPWRPSWVLGKVARLYIGEPSKKYHIQVLSNSTHCFLRSSKCKKLTDSDCCLTPSDEFFQLYDGEKKLLIMSVLYWNNT